MNTGNLNNSEKKLLEAIETIDKTKDVNTVTRSHLLNSPDLQTIELVKATLELDDILGLAKLLIINRSPLLKDYVPFMMKAIARSKKECEKLQTNNYCKDIIKYDIKILDKLTESIQKLGTNKR